MILLETLSFYVFYVFYVVKKKTMNKENSNKKMLELMLEKLNVERNYVTIKKKIVINICCNRCWYSLLWCLIGINVFN